MDMIGLDPYEADLRRPLNLGHTIGHPIETAFGYRRIKHGEAVAIGLGVATAVAARRGIMTAQCAERILDLLSLHGLLGFREPIDVGRVLEHLGCVRLIRGNHLHFVLPVRIGEVLVTDDVSDRDLVAGFADLEDEVRRRARCRA
jgi:3-dehydroquinate synthase